jgi:hypothetical protein
MGNFDDARETDAQRNQLAFFLFLFWQRSFSSNLSSHNLRNDKIQANSIQKVTISIRSAIILIRSFFQGMRASSFIRTSTLLEDGVTRLLHPHLVQA